MGEVQVVTRTREALTIQEAKGPAGWFTSSGEWVLNLDKLASHRTILNTLASYESCLPISALDRDSNCRRCL